MVYYHLKSLTFPDATLLFIVSILAGGMNSVAGAGNLLAFPFLLFVGIPPILANATTTVGMWPGSMAGIGGYRGRMPRGAPLLIPLIGSSLIGGVLGAVLLLHTPSQTFMRMVPYLFLAATLFFFWGRRIDHSKGAAASSQFSHTWPMIAAVAFAQLGIATYGSFFGGGVGILMLSLLSLAHLGDIHTMNSVRVLLATVTKSLAVAMFVVAGVVVWPAAVLMVAGAVIGGYSGARLAQKVPSKIVNAFVVVVGLSMTVYFFIHF